MINRYKRYAIICIIGGGIWALIVIFSCKSALKDDKPCEILSRKMVCMEDIGLNDFTCTGMTYDNKEKVVWILDHDAGADGKYRVIGLSTNLTEVKNIVEFEIAYSPESINVQGCAYDKETDSIWIATGPAILNYDKSGNLLNAIEKQEFLQNSGANGICIDKNNTIWILCYKNLLINMDKQGNIIKYIPCNFDAQDMLTFKGKHIYITVGADYNGTENFVYSYDTKSGEFEQVFKAMDSFAIEGICFIGNKMLIANDGKYHDANIKKSYIAEYVLPLGFLSFRQF